MTYFIGASFQFHSLSRNADNLKSTFNIYVLNPPPSSTNKDYLSYIRATTNNNTDLLLEESDAKQVVV